MYRSAASIEMTNLPGDCLASTHLLLLSWCGSVPCKDHLEEEKENVIFTI